MPVMSLSVVLVVSLMLSVSLASNNHFVFSPKVDTIQADVHLHKVVTLTTDEKVHECSSYCSYRTGTSFGPNECGGFYVRNGTSDCHMIPMALQAITEAHAGEVYYIRTHVHAIETSNNV